MTFASINDLPNELFDVIFGMLYEMHWWREIRFFSWQPPSKDEGKWLGDPFEPSMFPFAQAKVCRRWCALLAYHPRYWTRIPIVVDPATTPPHLVRNHLTWSQGLPITVFVKSHPHVHSMCAIDETSYVDEILPHVSQHLYHIESLQFSLYHACIPNLPRWLVGPANRLKSLQLSHEGCPVAAPCAAHHHDSGPQVDGGPETFRFSASRLSWLSIDWRTFVQASRTDMSWLANAPCLSSFNLTLSGPCFPVDDLSVGDTLKVLSQRPFANFEILSVRNVPFADGDECFEPPDPWVCDSVTLEGLKGTAVAKFVDASGANCSCLTLNNCSLLGLDSFTALTLRLNDVDEDCDLTKTFDDLRTSEVSFCNCPAFNDAFLEFMAVGGPTGENFPAKGLGWLFLERCTNFSVECLYRMVLSRRMAMEESPDWDGTELGLSSDDVDVLSAIAALRVTGGPPLSEEYRAKFEQVVPGFSWT